MTGLFAAIEPAPTVFELFEDQAEALAMVRQAVAAGDRRIVLAAPTGSGKTVLAATIFRGVLHKGRRGVFTVPMLGLVEQTIDAFWHQNVRAVGVMQGIHPMTDGTQPVQIATVQTLRNRKIAPPDIMVVDECHVRDRALEELLAQPEWASVIVIGLSATPWARGMGRTWKTLLVPVTMAQLIAKERLVPYRVFAPSHPDLTGVRTRGGDYAEGELSAAMSKEKLVADVVTTWIERGEDRPTLCFAVDRAHAKLLQRQFLDAGVVAEYVDAFTDVKERKAIGERMRARTTQVVCNISTMTTGIDLPFVSCLIIARPTKSEMLFIQIVGRGLRVHGRSLAESIANGKGDCLILDHSSTTTTLGLPADIHYETLDDGSPRSETEKDRVQPRDKPRECPKCQFVRPKSVAQCPSCGFLPERQSKIEVEHGSLVEIVSPEKMAHRAPRAEKQRWYSGFLYIAVAKGMKLGWAKHSYREKFGSWPDDMSDRREPPAEDIRAWIRTRAIRASYGKRKHKRRA